MRSNVMFIFPQSGATKSCLRVSLCLKNLKNYYFSTYIFIVCSLLILMDANDLMQDCAQVLMMSSSP